MTLRKGLRHKAFTLIEMLVVIAIIAILAAALFPAIQGAIEQAKASALKNKGRGIWTAVITANSEREPLGLSAVWPNYLGSNTTSTGYFGSLMSGPSPICEDLKVGVFSGSGVNPAPDVTTFITSAGANNAWDVLCVSSNTSIIAEDAFIFTKNIVFSTMTPLGTPINSASTFASPALDVSHVTIKRGVYTTYGGGCFDRREKYLTTTSTGSATNWLVSSTNSYLLFTP